MPVINVGYDDEDFDDYRASSFSVEPAMPIPPYITSTRAVRCLRTTRTTVLIVTQRLIWKRSMFHSRQNLIPCRPSPSTSTISSHWGITSHLSADLCKLTVDEMKTLCTMHTHMSTSYSLTCTFWFSYRLKFVCFFLNWCQSVWFQVGFFVCIFCWLHLVCEAVSFLKNWAECKTAHSLRKQRCCYCMSHATLLLCFSLSYYYFLKLLASRQWATAGRRHRVT